MIILSQINFYEMKQLVGLAFLVLLFITCENKKSTSFSSPFVTVKDGKFFRNDKPYYYMGANYWYGMNLGSKGEGGDRNRLIRELDQMQQMGITNLRVIGLTEGPDGSPYRILPAVQDTPGILKEELLVGLDFFLNEMKKRDMTAVVVLNNFWPWSGGMAQYEEWNSLDSIPYPPPHPGGTWDGYQKYTAQFYTNKKAIGQYKNAVKSILTRKNTVNRTMYADDPTIMAWELCNEPRGINNTTAFNLWIDSTASFIKSFAPKQLVTTGSEGFTASKEFSGTDFVSGHDGTKIDYTTVHIWIQNWDWYNPAEHEKTYPSAKQKMLDYLHEHAKLSKKLGKPYVLEEFGIMRDSGSFNPNSSTKNRDIYYKEVFEAVYQLAKKGEASGVNFWAYGGEGRPSSLASWWKKGDDFTGDPPHEPQGWYSVNHTDTSTISIIREYATKFNKGF